MVGGVCGAEGLCGTEGGVNGRGCAWQGSCMVGGACMAGGHALRGDLHGGGGGVCVVGDMHGWGHAWLGGMYSGEMATEDTTNRSSQFSILSHCCEL